MSLRLRLTIFNIAILGSVLILVGIAMFTITSAILINQVDQNLSQAASDVIRLSQVDPEGQFSLRRQLSLNPNIVIQIWDTRGILIASTQSFNPQSTLVFPLFPQGLNMNDLAFMDVEMGDSHLRVLSVPVESETEPIGTLQAAQSLEEVDNVIQQLLEFLLVVGSIALGVAVLLGWFSTRQAMLPLTTMTDTALQITSADDLSQRIPQLGSQRDEVGKMIKAFNQTLERMEDLLESQKRFVADVGHELRTPLTVMKGNVDLMRMEANIDLDSLKSIEDEVDRMTRLVNDLLLLAQAESGKMTLDHKPVELDTLLLEVFQQAHVLADAKTELTIDEIDQAIVCGDRDRLKQLLLNLVLNAIRYSPQGGVIGAKLVKRDEMALLIIKDNGMGISQEDLPHIFERFYRGEKSRSRSKDGKGFGLGLPIADWIVKSHGGRIEVNSEVGKGTSFSVWLPLNHKDCSRKFPTKNT